MEDRLNNPNFQNWVKSVLYLDAAATQFRDFAEEIMEQWHQTTTQAHPLPTNHTICSFQDAAKCPFGTCDKFKQVVVAAHWFDKPTYGNTELHKCWTNSWELAKCYMPYGYKDVHTASETDFAGVVTVILNHLEFQKHVTPILTDRNNTFYQAKDVRNSTMHNSSFEMTSQTLQYNYTVIHTTLNALKGRPVFSTLKLMNELYHSVFWGPWKSSYLLELLICDHCDMNEDLITTALRYPKQTFKITKDTHPLDKVSSAFKLAVESLTQLQKELVLTIPEVKEFGEKLKIEIREESEKRKQELITQTSKGITELEQTTQTGVITLKCETVTGTKIIESKTTKASQEVYAKQIEGVSVLDDKTEENAKLLNDKSRKYEHDLTSKANRERTKLEQTTQTGVITLKCETATGTKIIESNTTKASQEVYAKQIEGVGVLDDKTEENAKLLNDKSRKYEHDLTSKANRERTKLKEEGMSVGNAEKDKIRKEAEKVEEALKRNQHNFDKTVESKLKLLQEDVDSVNTMRLTVGSELQKKANILDETTKYGLKQLQTISHTFMELVSNETTKHQDTFRKMKSYIEEADLKIAENIETIQEKEKGLTEGADRKIAEFIETVQKKVKEFTEHADAKIAEYIKKTQKTETEVTETDADTESFHSDTIVDYRAPALYLRYDDNFKGDMLVQDVNVPSNGLTKQTYYCCLQWNAGINGGGYCGIQDHDKGRNYIFSIWEPNGTTEKIRPIYVGPGTICEPFGGEGTGLKSWNFDLGWDPGNWYTFVCRRWDQDEHTYYGVWVKHHIEGIWTHLVTVDFPVPKTYFETNTRSFLEDWKGTGQNERRVHFKNGYKRRVDETWIPFDKAIFDMVKEFSSRRYADNYDSGSFEETFYLQSGGKTQAPQDFKPEIVLQKTMLPEPDTLPISCYLTSVTEQEIVWEIPSGSVPQFQYIIKVGEYYKQGYNSEVRMCRIDVRIDDGVELLIEDLYGKISRLQKDGLKFRT